MATTSRSAAGRKAAPRRREPATEASAPAETYEVNGNPLDNVLDDWSQTAAKEQIAWELSTGNALLRSAQQLQQVQLEAARRTQQAHEEAAERLKRAGSITELAAVQMELARADAEGALQYWTKLGELTTKSAIDLLNETASGYAKMQNAAWSAMVQLSRARGSIPTTPEALEAEVEHVTNPVTSGPMVWPAQEATRQVMDLAAAGWNEWLSWTGRVAGMATGEERSTR